MPLGQYGRKRPPSFSLLPRCQGECGLHKEAREACPLQLPEPGLFRTVIKRQSLPQLWWQLAQTRHKRLARSSGRLVLKPGQHQNRFVRSLQLGSAAWPPAAQTKSASTPQRVLPATGCGRRAILIRPGNRPLPGRTCFAACGGGRRGANGDGLYLQAVRQRRSSGRCSPFDAHGLIPLDSPGEYALQFAQETSRYGASRRPR